MSVIPSVINYLYELKRNKKEVTVKFKVWGNCGKCKARIEKCLKCKGVKKGIWDMDSRMLTVTFNPKIISLEQIHEKLGRAGHDTEELYTTEKLYDHLPKCCKYIREK